MPIVSLSERSLLMVTGTDAEALLQNILTLDIAKLAEGEARLGTLLTPQGKILFDFLLSRVEDGFRFDCSASLVEDFRKRLLLYRLRAKIDFSIDDQTLISTSWGNDSLSSSKDSVSLADRRFPSSLNVYRHYGPHPAGATTASQSEWDQLRIHNGVPESGADYSLSDAFPHDILLDQNEGVGLAKGCYVGQEVVSRMQHRGTARRRLLIVTGDRKLPQSGTQITVQDRNIGVLGTVSGQDGLAILRVDRAASAIAQNMPILAGEARLELKVPPYANFTISSSGPAETD